MEHVSSRVLWHLNSVLILFFVSSRGCLENLHRVESSLSRNESVFIYGTTAAWWFYGSSLLTPYVLLLIILAGRPSWDLFILVEHVSSRVLWHLNSVLILFFISSLPEGVLKISTE